LEQFVLAKYYLTAQVYSHRVRLITDQMMVRAISLGIEEDEINDLKSLYSYDGRPEFIGNYMGWNDSRFMLRFGSADFNGTYCQDLVHRLSERRLLKQIFKSRVGQLPESCRDSIRRVSNRENREARRDLEQRLAGAILEAGVKFECRLQDPSKLLIGHAYSLKSVRAQSRNDEAPIMVHEVPDPVPFEQASDLFNSIQERLNDPHFAVYAPVAYENPVERERLKQKVKEPIIRCLEDFGNGR
jgi:HD superfamily phosphohydrolase